MSVTLKQAQALREIARLLYSFLPGSGHASWKGHVSFATVARDVGVGDFWQGGSKEPAIASLIERTLDKRPNRFEPLVLIIVKHGMTYRGKQGQPIRREEIETLNGLLVEAGFKFPDLWDAAFLGSLNGDSAGRARDMAQSMQRVSDSSPSVPGAAELADLRSRFYQLEDDTDRQAAGLALEKLLNDLFNLSGLEPRQPFSVVGEQIDGSFQLDLETYLVEAKWVKEKISEGALLVFRGKVEGKSAFTRGVFISLNGFTSEALDAITRGKQPIFFLVDGYDLVTILEGQIELPALLRLKLRKLTEEGRVLASAKDLLSTASSGEGEPVTRAT